MKHYNVSGYNGWINPTKNQAHFYLRNVSAKNAADAIRKWHASHGFATMPQGIGPAGVRCNCIIEIINGKPKTKNGLADFVPASELTSVLRTFKARNGEDILVTDGFVII